MLAGFIALSALLSACVTMSPTPAPAEKGRPVLPAAKPVKIEPPVSAESRQLYEQALAALVAGHFVDAERGLLAVTRRDPGLAGPHANLGIVYARTNRVAQAIESLQQAIKLNPDRAAYHNELGLIYRREGKFDDARRQYDKAIDADPNYVFAHLNLGILYDLYLGDAGKALAHYQRYRDLVPSEASTVAKWIADLQQRQRGGGAQARGGNSG
jgi:Flp pilus assembly protein TadD